MRRLTCFTMFILLVACVPSAEPPPPRSGPIPTQAPTSTAPPPATLTLQPTLASDQYPKLAQFVLRPEDVPPDEAYFRSYFWSRADWSIPPLTKELTSSLEEQGSCALDCVKLEWTNSESPSRYVEISLTREESMQKAIQVSFDLCTSLLHDATLHWTTPWAPASFDDCRSEMQDTRFTPYTWILGFSAADVSGSVLIRASVSQLGGDDFGIHQDVLHTLLELQIEKLESLHFPVSP
jgi:hypothetical protein